MKIGILDYGVGNIRSVFNAIKYIGFEPTLVSEPSDISKFDHIVSPGVGNFGHVVNCFREKGFEERTKEYINRGGFYLGICVGMQMLFENSEESSDVKGLGLLTGYVEKLNINGDRDIQMPTKKCKLPHVGWKSIQTLRDSSGLADQFFNGLDQLDKFYFVHSYHAIPVENDLVATIRYGGLNITATVMKDNLIGTQFHPERSRLAGLTLLSNFCGLK